MTERAGVVPQLLGAAVGIVLGSALLFAVVGMLRGDGPVEPEVAAEPSPSETVAAADEEAADSPTSEASDEDAAPVEEASPTPEASEPAAAPSPEPSPEPAPATESSDEVDPGSVSIQVLDAVGGEGGDAAAQEVADELRAAGFNVVVINRAGRTYEVTTVFWSEGQQAGGQQVAAAIGAGRAEETPDEVQLSDSVDVHVVVGADRT